MTSAASRRRRGTGHELRDVVLRVATDLLAQLGDVDALTMRAVATASGVTAPSVYRHFPDKEALVRTVIAERFDAFASVLLAATASAGDEPMRRLEATAQAYVRAGLEQPGHYRLLFSAKNAGPAGLGVPDDTEHPGAASFGTLVEVVAACLPAPRRALALPLAMELWASLHGIVDLRITKPEVQWPDGNELAHVALAAVRAAADPDPHLPRPTESLVDVPSFVTLVVTGFVSCAEFGSYAFVHPVIRRLAAPERITVEQGLLKTFGRVMPIAMTLSVVLAIIVARGGEGGPLSWSAAAAFAAALVSTLIVNVPINCATGRWHADQPPPGWDQTRERWELFQGVRSWLLLLGFVVVCAASTT